MQPAEPAQRPGDSADLSRAAAQPAAGDMRRISSAVTLSLPAGKAGGPPLASTDAPDAEEVQRDGAESAEEDTVLLPYSPAASPSKANKCVATSTVEILQFGPLTNRAGYHRCLRRIWVWSQPHPAKFCV